jgi:protein ImuB
MFACAFIPDFPVQSVLRCEAESLKHLPVLILEGKPPLVHVTALNDVARAKGFYVGMPKTQAEVSNDAVLRMRSASQEENAYAALIDCAGSLSPRVEATGADSVVVDISGLENLFGRSIQIARELANRIVKIGLEPNVAVAPNVEAAQIAAKGIVGINVLEERDAGEKLGALPLEVLSPELEVLEVLESWGIRTLRALAALPPIPITQRFGQYGLQLQQLARGEGSRPLVPADAKLRFEETFEFEDAVELLEPLSFILARLFEQLCTRMSVRALAVSELKVACKLEVHPDRDIKGSNTSHFEHYERSIKLAVPLLDRKVFLKLVELDLAAHPNAPIKSITVTLEPARPRAVQNSVFVPTAPRPEKLEVLLARIAKVIQTNPDESRVGTPVLLDVHRPDAFRLEKFSALPSSPNPCCAASPVIGFRVCRPPQSIVVNLEDQKPRRLIFNGRRANVMLASGPWKLSGEWWTEKPWKIEQWDVSVEENSAIVFYRIFREVWSGKWFLEGTYD